MTILWDWCYHYHFHFLSKETEAQRNQITCLRSGKQSQEWLQQGLGYVLNQNSTLPSECPELIPQEYLFHLRSGCGVYYNIIHPFVFFFRSSAVRARKRACLEPWVIGLITFISLIVLAVCIGLIVHYARYSKYEFPGIMWFTSNISRSTFLFWFASGLFIHYHNLFTWIVQKDLYLPCYSFNLHKPRKILSSTFDVAMLPAGNIMLVFIFIEKQ